MGLCVPRYFRRYPANRGHWFVSSYTCKSLVGLLCLLGSSYVLKSWAQHNQEAGRNTETGKYLTLYGLTILVSSLLSFFGSVVLWVWCVVRSARYLHDKVLAALLRSPLSFFDTTPSGRYVIHVCLSTSLTYLSSASSMSFQGTSTSSTRCWLVSSRISSGPERWLWEQWRSSASASRFSLSF